MQKLTRSEVVKMVCEMVEKADVPGYHYVSTGRLLAQYTWGGDDLCLSVVNNGEEVFVAIDISQQDALAPQVMSEWLPRLSAVTALAVSIEAALKEVEVIE